MESAWKKGVRVYAEELRENCDGELTEKNLLNGAPNWHEYSWGGCSLIYDQDIAERLCAPWELKRTQHGKKAPNSHEHWLDVQARALYQACRLLLKE